MKTLEFKDIAGYLPYSLHCLDCDDMIEEIDFTNTGELISGIDLQDEAEDDAWVACRQYKPILRPLDDLYKTITHNGKEIVPIVELAKINNPTRNWELSFCDPAAIVVSEMFDFDYYDGFFCYETISALERRQVETCNQYKLFDFLHELKIDYRGLIDAGLAVDANTLENNPYK